MGKDVQCRGRSETWMAVEVQLKFFRLRLSWGNSLVLRSLFAVTWWSVGHADVSPRMR